MANIFTLIFGTYNFPNQTFEIDGHQISLDTPAVPIRRSNGGVVLDGFIVPKKFVIRGKIFGDDKDQVHATLIAMQRAVHNGGKSAAFRYRGDRYVPEAWLSQEGINAAFEKGLYENMYNVDLVLVARRPFAESDVLVTLTGSRTNSSAIQAATTGGDYPASPVFTVVAGTWAFMNGIRVENDGNSQFWSWGGPFAAGQTLVVDCDLGCVLLHRGSVMVDAISYFSGNLFMRLEPDGVPNNLVINGATLSYSIKYRDRWYS